MNQVRLTDFDEFDYIFAMDRSNLQDLQRLKQRKPTSTARVMLFGEHSGGRIEEVEDPYYGGSEGFEIAYEQCLRFSTNFLRHLFPDIES
jgi:low molecular weight phosphotyrosine protein phosphatase